MAPLPGGDIGGTDLGVAEDELIGLVDIPVKPWLARAYARVWRCIFDLRGDDSIYRRNVEGAKPIRVSTKTIFRRVRDYEMIGDVQASDDMALISLPELETSSLEWPPHQFDLLIDRSTRASERLLGFVTKPEIVAIANYQIFMRVVARHGA